MPNPKRAWCSTRASATSKAEKVIQEAEFVALQDSFGHQRLREGKYTPGQIDTRWTDDIKQDFMRWIEQNPGKVSMSKAELDQFLKAKNW